MPCRRSNARWLCSALASTALFAQNLPDGPGKDVVERACGVCHPATIVMGRNMNRDQWKAEVTRMVQEGAKLTDAEFTLVVDYLAKAFPSGPNASVTPAPQTIQGSPIGKPLTPWSPAVAARFTLPTAPPATARTFAPATWCSPGNSNNFVALSAAKAGDAISAFVTLAK